MRKKMMIHKMKMKKNLKLMLIIRKKAKMIIMAKKEVMITTQTKNQKEVKMGIIRINKKMKIKK